LHTNEIVVLIKRLSGKSGLQNDLFVSNGMLNITLIIFNNQSIKYYIKCTAERYQAHANGASLDEKVIK